MRLRLKCLGNEAETEVPGNEAGNAVFLTLFCLSGVVRHLIGQGPGYDPGVDAARLEEERQGIERPQQTAHGKYGTESDGFNVLYQEPDTGMELQGI